MIDTFCTYCDSWPYLLQKNLFWITWECWTFDDCSEDGAHPSVEDVCFAQEQVGGAQPSSQREQTLVALRAEVARLEEAESLQRAADSALNSLQDKIADLKVSICALNMA